jgi:glutamine---fructose-6-phosphate transaminase (isomerizing)
VTGLVGAVAAHNVTPMLVEGLRRLEAQRDDSAGIALLHNGNRGLELRRCVGRIGELQFQLWDATFANAGIGHTRPTTLESHPRLPHAQVSNGEIAVVHSGDFLNGHLLRPVLEAKGYRFESDSETELAAHLIHDQYCSQGSLLQAVRQAESLLEGHYALAAVASREPDCLVVARHGRPLVVGVGAEGKLVASETSALLPWARRCIFLEDRDVAELRRDGLVIVDRRGHAVYRTLHALDPGELATA